MRPGDCYALLDDCTAIEKARSRLYTGLVRELACAEPEDLSAVCDEAEAAMRSGLHALLLCGYGFGERLQSIARFGNPAGDAGLRILLFSEMSLLRRGEVDERLATLDRDGRKASDAGESADARGCTPPSPAGVCDLQASVTSAEYDDVVAAIRRKLAAGDCYQINYTYRLEFTAFGTPVALYRRLRARQPTPYGALIELGNGGAILSFSPELFVEYRDGRLRARPMKGTARAGPNDDGSDAETRGLAAALAADPKNRAENLMIVDLLRNDLGRIAKTGSVRVPELFSVERHGGVLQMTSTVEAVPRPPVVFADVLRALFPCGSITGAPKRHAMESIARLEFGDRGLYSGAIGWLEAPRSGGTAPSRLGEFCLSVAIRTLMLDPPSTSANDEESPPAERAMDVGTRKGSFGVGGGIVIDSEPKLEYEECALKARFLTGLDPGFALFETIYATREAGCRNLPLHIARLRASAARFGFRFDESDTVAALELECARLSPGLPARVRVELAHDGALTTSSAPLPSLSGPVELLVSAAQTDARDLFLRHKTTLRKVYDDAWRAAERAGAFDTLFFNTRDELTEGARSNVFLLLAGRWCTPPLRCGLLPGVVRRVLLADKNMDACERILTRGDLAGAQGIVVCNALRGVMPAVLAEPLKA